MNRIGRKIAAAWLAAAMAAFLAAGCGGGGNTPAQDAETSSHIGAQDKEDESDGITIDYGTSSIYTREDMDAAIAKIQAEFRTWKGCELHAVRYMSDDCNSERNIEWMNELANVRNQPPFFEQCIAFESEFHSPKEPPEASAWEPDKEYVGWQWWLARRSGEDWILLTNGY